MNASICVAFAQSNASAPLQLGRIIVLPVEDPGADMVFTEEHQPLMLLALNSTDAVEWEELDTKVFANFL